MSQRFTASISLSFASTRLESGLTSTSATSRRRASALSAIGWVTKTRGRLTTFFAAFLIAALTLGSTFSASKVIERLASFGSRQSLPA